MFNCKAHCPRWDSQFPLCVIGCQTQLEFAHLLNQNNTILTLLIKLGEGNSFSTIRTILMLGGHTAHPKWVSYLNVWLACDSSPLGCVFAGCNHLLPPFSSFQNTRQLGLESKTTCQLLVFGDQKFIKQSSLLDGYDLVMYPN